MAKFHVDSIQEWQPFEHDGVKYDLGHLSSHLVIFKADKKDYEFVVTYGLHCFTKDDTGTNIPYWYEDGRHGQMVCLERYEASKQLMGIIEKLDAATIYHTEGERFFTMRVLNSATGLLEPYKVCLAFYREHRLLRIHVTSAYFARTGEGSADTPISKKGFSIFKVAMDTQKKPKGQCPKEVRNRPKPQK
ncbi:hypothetical protein ALP73_01080 [Pseudomonas coronafaciens pv. garcae]|uniref:hypothetical protein n=1 Tax=Pseudomonas syringae group TaxID=136849 RepID=UPI000E3156A4|nr:MULTISPECIES: hypothetical protein [Pseudomonas syringae group]RMS09354.1 hypothetical protein ALP73_01080 [Pseudomonas coronafaciens pv. garcae]